MTDGGGRARDELHPARLVVAELRRAVRGDGLAAVTGAVLVVLCIGVMGGRRLAQGPLPPETALSAALVVASQILPVAVSLAVGWRFVRRKDAGVDVSLHLAGHRAADRCLVMVADGLILSAAAAAALVAAVVASSASPSAAVGPGTAAGVIGVVTCVALVSLLAGVTARLAAGTASFLLLTVFANLVGSALYFGGSTYPGLALLGRFWPWQAASAPLTATSGVRWLASVSVVLLFCLLAQALHLGSGRRGPSGGAPSHAKPGSHAGPWSARRTALVATAGLLTFGFFVPAALAPLVPWYLRPQWLSEVGSSTASTDVATGWAQERQRDASRGGVLEPSLGPLAPLLLRARPGSATVDQTANGDPGTVRLSLVDAPLDDRTGPAIFVCLNRPDGTWTVTGLRSAPDCPATLPRVRPE